MSPDIAPASQLITLLQMCSMGDLFLCPARPEGKIPDCSLDSIGCDACLSVPGCAWQVFRCQVAGDVASSLPALGGSGWLHRWRGACPSISVGERLCSFLGAGTVVVKHSFNVTWIVLCMGLQAWSASGFSPGLFGEKCLTNPLVQLDLNGRAFLDLFFVLGLNCPGLEHLS